jgi:hypothetical protein
MREQEAILIKELNDISNANIKAVDNVYSSYDCYSDNAIIELKIRNKVYSDKMIELNKMTRCLRIAESKDKSFVYVVKDASGIYYLDITSNKDIILSSEPVEMFCPATSEFENTKKLNKLAYNLKMIKIK